jgi:isochorismate synthase
MTDLGMKMIATDTAHQQINLTKIKVDAWWAASKSLGYPSALWRLPHTNQIQLLITMDCNGISEVHPELEKLPPGFMIAPFDWKHEEPALYLHGDILMSFDVDGQLQKLESRLGEEHTFFNELSTLAHNLPASEPISKSGIPPLTPLFSENGALKEKHKQTVSLAISAITQKLFNKVVLSRTKEMSIQDSFQPVASFYKLTEAYQDAFVSLVYLPKSNEMWLGASPETLIQQTPEGIFKTMSLAATQTAIHTDGTPIPRTDIRWGQKEIEEQALVSRYIVECFKKIRLREYQETGPKTVQAGNLYHLRTDFEVNTDTLKFPELATVMLALLHPTSAICGVPKEPSREFILKHEGYDRSLYSGFLGPVNIQDKTSLFVNLRTVRLKEGIATFYAGGGITEDSDPESEWHETEIKCETLLNVIGGDC